MIIKNINVENFKCLAKNNFEFSKITLLTGANSSGKSSLLYSLLGIIQTNRFPFYYSLNGDYVNMGDYGELINRHVKSKPLTFNLTITLRDKKQVSIVSEFSENRYDKMPRLKYLKIDSTDFTLRIEKGKKYLAEYNYNPNKDTGNGLIFTQDDYLEIMEGFFKVVNKIVDKQVDKKRKKVDLKLNMKDLFRKAKLSASFEFHKVDDFFSKMTDPKYVWLGLYVNSIIDNFKHFRNSFNYISSFRLEPERTYYRKSKTALKISRLGENYIDQILEWEYNKSKNFTKVKQILRDLKLLEDIKTQKITGGRFNIIVKTILHGIESSISDVGFGVSQFLPIIVADVQLGKNSTFLVSQPEIHLHPSVQANLANYFLESMKEDNKRYIIETHSEYLINRFRLLIAENKLKEKDIAIYHLKNLGDYSEQYEVEFKKDGSIEGAPEDFFETYLMDMKNLALIEQ